MCDEYRPGLEGVIAARTRLSRVDGEAGELLLAGYPVEELAPRATFEELVHLFWHDRLPTRDELGARSPSRPTKISATPPTSSTC